METPLTFDHFRRDNNNNNRYRRSLFCDNTVNITNTILDYEHLQCFGMQ